MPPKIIKLVAALVLFGICMGFRGDVSESWLRMLLAAIGFGLMAWGVLQMFFKNGDLAVRFIMNRRQG